MIGNHRVYVLDMGENHDHQSANSSIGPCGREAREDLPEDQTSTVTLPTLSHVEASA